MTDRQGQFSRVIALGFLMGLLMLGQGYGQGPRSRIRAGETQPTPAPPPTPVSAPQAPFSVPGQPAATAPVSLLQQPAKEAQILFADDRLSIHADNSSLTGILHEIATKSGMKITGLNSDERVFGVFGPGAPRDVLADLLNGTSYNQLLLGDLANGAPRELILTPVTRAGEAAASSPSVQANAEDAVPEQESAETPPPPPPDVPPPPPGNPGVRTPQQLFEQLQQMRQAQQQQVNPNANQDSPLQPPPTP